jgi:hypothetical protein
MTGAYPFDKWFSRSPSRSAPEFKREVGLPEDLPYILFVGSTASISAPTAEQEFVCEWLQALRSSPDASLRESGVLVRPHPYNSEHWSEFDLATFSPVTIWPPVGSDPLTDEERNDFFDSLYYADAVVGVNTSAMIEAAIVGRPVLTVTPPQFGDTQLGTLHFKHLLPENGGFVRRAVSLEEHLEQLRAVLASSDAEQECAAFVSWFVRPLGLERPATLALVDTIEDAFRAGSRRRRSAPIWAKPVIGLFLLLDGIDRAVTPDGKQRRRPRQWLPSPLARRRKRYGRRVRRLEKALRRRRKTYRKAWHHSRRHMYQTIRRRAPRRMQRVAKLLAHAVRGRSRATTASRR